MLARRTGFPTLFRRENDEGNNASRFTDWLDQAFEEALHDTSAFVPRLNVAETEKEFEVTVALPGMKKNDIDVNLDNNVLTISGERKREDQENGRKYRVVETRYGKFSRSLTLPNIIDADNVKANFRNGELTITIPKQEEKAGKKIKVS